MKKVMFYCHVFYPQNSGYSNAFQNLINAVLDYYEDIDITVVTPYPLGNNEELKKDRLNIIRLKPKIKIRKIKYIINDYFFAKKVSKIFKNGKFDSLFVETFDQAIFLNFLDRDIYNKLIVRVHSTNETEYTFWGKALEYKIRKFMIRNFLNKNILNIASTNNFHIKFVKKYYFKDNLIEIGNKNFYVLPNTLNFNIQCDNLEAGEKLNLFLLGRMDKLGINQKGFLDFIYSLKLIKLIEPDIINKFDVTIVGDGDERQKLIELSKDFNNINFIRKLSHNETIEYLKESDIVILPSRYEGLSMFALESLATGNAVIFSKTGGLIDLVENNGLLFEPQNIESLAKSLIEITKLNKKDILNMKFNSIKLYERKFFPYEIAKKFRLILEIIGD